MKNNKLILKINLFSTKWVLEKIMFIGIKSVYEKIYFNYFSDYYFLGS